MGEEKNVLPWKHCVVGNIKKTHIDADGVLRYGTAAYTGGTKVYLCGRFWNNTRDSITVIGLNRRGRKFQINEVPVDLIENVRCQRVYNSAVLDIMGDWEFSDLWWNDTDEDKLEVKNFVAKWNEA